MPLFERNRTPESVNQSTTERAICEQCAVQRQLFERTESAFCNKCISSDSAIIDCVYLSTEGREEESAPDGSDLFGRRRRQLPASASLVIKETAMIENRFLNERHRWMH